MSCSQFSCKRSFSQPVANIFQHLAVKAAKCITKGISPAFMTSLSIFLVLSCLDPASKIQPGKYQSRVINNSNTDLLGRKASSGHWLLFRDKVHFLEIPPQERGVTELCCPRQLNSEHSTSSQPTFFSLHLFYF